MTAGSPERARYWKWCVCGLLLFGTTINYMDRQTLANAATRITREFGLSQEQYGNLELAFGWSFAVGSLLSGLAADRVPIRLLYPAVLFAWSTMGFITSYMTSYSGLLFCRALLGLFEAGHWPCALRTTQLLLDGKDRAMGNSVLQSGASVGAIITPLVMRAMLTDQPGSWRQPFQVFALIGVAWIAIWFFLIRPGDLLWKTKADADDANRGSKAGLREIIFSRRFAVLLIVVVSINMSWHLLRAWLPKFLMEGRQYTESDALYFTSLYYVATDVGCIGAGLLTLALSRRGMSVHGARSATFLCGAVLTSLTLVAAALPRGPALLAVLFLIGAGALAVFPCYYAWSQELSTRHQGTITGMTGVFAWAFSAVIHPLFGRLIDRTHSFDLGLAVAGCSPLIGFLAVWLIWKEPPRQAGAKLE
jgi:ACS family hexuronate transporter-like MFS transporter